MKRNVTVGMLGAAAIVATAGLASSAMADIITPTDFITWGQAGGGRAVPTPSGFTWSWTNSSPASQVAIDQNGRVYFFQTVTSTPTIGALTAPRAVFSGTNSSDLSIWGGIYDSGPLGGGQSVGQLNSSGAFTLTGLSSAIRVSGTYVGFGVGHQGTGIINTGAGQNNSYFAVGTGGSLMNVAQRFDTITLKDVAGNDTIVNNTIDFRGLSHQNGNINSSGAFAYNGGVAAAAGSGGGVGQFVAGNPTAAPFGNTGYVAVRNAAGVTTVIAQGGQAAPGGGLYRNGTTGAGGFNVKINATGQVYYDSRLVNTGLVTTTNDDVAYVYTPGVGSQRIYREGQAAPDATGLPDTGGALFSGALAVPNRGFSDAGVFYAGTLTSGDVVTTDPNTHNGQGLYIATTSGTTRVVRRNDIAPGFTAGDNVRIGTTNNSSMGMNNNGFVTFGNALQGSGVTQPVSVVYNTTGPILTPVSVNTPGIQGNADAIIAGTAGNLQIIAREGSPIPFTTGLKFNLEIGGLGLMSNNANQVIFTADSTTYSAGETIGVAGGALDTVRPSGPRFLMSWSPAYGLIPLLYSGQVVEVETGVFRTISQFNVFSSDNGIGGAQGFNDNGQVAMWVQFNEGGWGVLKLQVPAPGTGLMALLGVGAMARRRRRN